MGLEKYNAKRNFSETPEPTTAKTKKAGEKIFVVQRHKASRLHYDFRLEMEGVLKSWAVPKGPSLLPADKRLAMMTEDHPIDYAGFSGVIPEGNYGAGIVEIWDRGTYELSPEHKGTDLEGIQAGAVKVVLKGKKLKGTFALVKLRRGEENAWLLVKDRDQYAVSEPYNAEDDTPKNSAITAALQKDAKGKKETPSGGKKASTPKTTAAAGARLSDENADPENKPEREIKTKSAGSKNKAISQGSSRIASLTGSQLRSKLLTPALIKRIPLTNLDKVYWPQEGYTKGDLIAYYHAVSKYMLPYLKGRPQSLNRHPNGIEGESFYQKDMGDKLPAYTETVRIFSESNSREIDYLLCNNKDTLLYMANLGCIEINPWNSLASRPENPDYLVIDLDPSAGNTFEEVIEVAQVVKELCEKIGAAAYPKTSGSTGIHIYLPLGAKYSYDESRMFAELLAKLTVQSLPKLSTVERTIAKRGGKLYVDYLQNRGGQTLAAVYSARPKPGAPVSMPLHWHEVKKGLKPTDFNLFNAIERIEREGDLFKPVLKKGIDMKKCIEGMEQKFSG